MDVQLSDNAAKELREVTNFADDFRTLVSLCANNAHLGGSTNLANLQSMVCAWFDLSHSMDALADHIDLRSYDALSPNLTPEED